jgi:hypothetical protein
MVNLSLKSNKKIVHHPAYPVNILFMGREKEFNKNKGRMQNEKCSEITDSAFAFSLENFFRS